MPALCVVCGNGDMIHGDNCTLYCRNCGVQAANYLEEAFDAEDANVYNATFVRERGIIAGEDEQLGLGNSQRKEDCEDSVGDWTVGADGQAQYSRADGAPQHDSQLGQGTPATEASNREQLAHSIRRSYVGGLQKILQLQCECLVKDFGVTPLICGIVGPIWVRYVAWTRVFQNVWAEEAIEVAEHRERIRKGNSRRLYRAESKEPAPAQPAFGSAETAMIKQRGKIRERKIRGTKGRKRKFEVSLRTSYGRPYRSVWLSALKERLPLSMTLALSYLACYIAREPVLPTDISKWSSTGQLPYLAAFVEISKPAPNHIPNTVGGKPVFPMEPRVMFQPSIIVGPRAVELQAAQIAERVGIQLPSVNFHAVCARLLRDMGLPVEQVSAYACRLYEWYTPSGLWLSAQEEALPTRVYVVAMLIITLKVLYKLDGSTSKLKEEMETQKTSKRLPRSKDEGNHGDPQPLRKMITRAKRRVMTDVQASEDKENNSLLTQKSIKTHEVGTSAMEDELSTGNFHILGRRKSLSGLSTSEQAKGSKIGGYNMHRLDEARNSKVFNPNVLSQGEMKDLGDAQGLVEQLNSVKETNIMNFDEQLASYLKYCQHVIFSGYEPDADCEPILSHFRRIYEENMAQGASKLVADSDKAVADTFKHAELAFGGGLQDGAEGWLGEIGKVIARKSNLQSASHVAEERAAGVVGEAHSAGSLTSMGTRVVRMKQKKPKNEKENKEVVVAQNGCEDCEPTPAKVIEAGNWKGQGSLSLVTIMKDAGFSCLPPWPGCVGADEYLRYSFYVQKRGLILVHEDYFNVLQACGQLIEVHAKALHRCVQIVEKGLLQVEANVEKVLLGEKGDVYELACGVRRRQGLRLRDKITESKTGRKAVEMAEHLVNLSYL